MYLPLSSERWLIFSRFELVGRSVCLEVLSAGRSRRMSCTEQQRPCSAIWLIQCFLQYRRQLHTSVTSVHVHPSPHYTVLCFVSVGVNLENNNSPHKQKNYSLQTFQTVWSKETSGSAPPIPKAFWQGAWVPPPQRLYGTLSISCLLWHAQTAPSIPPAYALCNSELSSIPLWYGLVDSYLHTEGKGFIRADLYTCIPLTKLGLLYGL